MQRNWLKQLMNWSLRIVMLTLFVAIVIASLSGCAQQTVVKPSEPQPIPESLLKKSTPSADDFSQKVSIFLSKVTNWLEGLL
nr:MAG TPA: protein of unknown function (DUF4969) [Caudoviricetes sp.]